MDPLTAIAAASSITSLVQFSGTVLSKGYSYSSKVLRAPKELRLLLIETAALHSLLDQLQLLIDDDSGAGKTALLSLERVGVIAESRDILSTVDRCIVACRQVEGQFAMNLGKRLLWPFKDRETRELLQRFYQVRENFTSALTVDAAATLKQIERSTKSAEDHAAYIRLEYDQRRMEEKHTKIQEWIIYETTNPAENYEAALNCRQTGTGSWFLEEPCFVQWVSETSGLMWIYGIPGSGKTVLSSTIIEHLMASVCAGVGLIYFYCDHQDPKKQTFRNFLGAGISQLLKQRPQCMEDIIELYTRKGGEAAGKPSIEECLQLLKTITLHFTTIYIVVDALDECSEVEAFFAGLNRLRSSRPPKMTVKVLLTSRQEVPIQRQILPYATQSLCLTTNIGPDIRRFITGQVHAHVSTNKLKFRDPDLQRQIIAALCDGADGMFLWAKIQLIRICKLRTDRDIRKALKTLPSGLDDTFIRVLEHIQSENPEAIEEVRKVFQWMIGSFRPLPLVMIAEAISIQPEDTALDHDGIANDLDDIVAICGGLVIMDRSFEIPRISFAHFSIEEFLQSDRIRQSSVATFYVDPSDTHFELAKTSIQYLSFSDFAKPCSTDEIDARVSTHRLWPYAAQEWIKHLNASDIDSEKFQNEILPRLEWFLHPTPHGLQFHSWNQVFVCMMPSLERFDGRKQSIPGQPAIFYALLYSMDLVLDYMFAEDVGVEQRFWDDMTPLHVAAFSGHYFSIDRLLKARANVDAVTACKSLTPLHIAAERGHAPIVKILLANGADLHARSSSGSTPFYRGVRGGSLEILDMLRAHGSNINARTLDDSYPLNEAFEMADLDFVKRLAEWGAVYNVGKAKALGNMKTTEILSRQDSRRL